MQCSFIASHTSSGERQDVCFARPTSGRRTCWWKEIVFTSNILIYSHIYVGILFFLLLLLFSDYVHFISFIILTVPVIYCSHSFYSVLRVNIVFTLYDFLVPHRLYVFLFRLLVILFLFVPCISFLSDIFSSSSFFFFYLYLPIFTPHTSF